MKKSGKSWGLALQGGGKSWPPAIMPEMKEREMVARVVPAGDHAEA